MCISVRYGEVKAGLCGFCVACARSVSMSVWYMCAHVCVCICVMYKVSVIGTCVV